MKQGDILGLALVGAALWWLYGRPATPAGSASQPIEVNQDSAPNGLPANGSGSLPTGDGGSLPSGGGVDSSGGEGLPTGTTRYGWVTVCGPVRMGAGYITMCQQVFVELPSGHPPLLDA